VPQDRQLEVWKEVGENPQHAQHVRNVINGKWLDASHALFDVSVLAENVVSRDLFGDRVLVERQAFFEAQLQALQAERTTLLEQGWSEVVVGTRAEFCDRLWAMAEAEPQFYAATERKLAKIDERADSRRVGILKHAIASLSRFDRIRPSLGRRLDNGVAEVRSHCVQLFPRCRLAARGRALLLGSPITH
jgi:hypothetical protein